MAFFDTTWYCNAGDQSTTGYYAVAKRPQNTAVVAGQIVRQFTAPAVGSERCFVCIVAGTTANVTDATWVLTRGAKTTDGTATWQECTGASAVNGDLTNTPTWAAARAINVAVTLGAIIQRNSGASYQICSTTGSVGASEPAFSNTAGVTTNDGSVVWTSLGAVGSFTGGGAPHARLAAACALTWMAAGNTIYIGANHAETQGSANAVTTIGSSTGLIARILCHNNAGSYPPASSDITTGASISTSGAFSLTITAGGSLYVYGVTFKAGVSGAAANVSLQASTAVNQNWLYYDNCSFQLAGSTPTNSVLVGTTSNIISVTFNNCTVSFANTGQFIAVGNAGLFRWQNTGSILFSGSSVPTAMFGQTGAAATVQNVELEAVDLSQITGNLYASVGANLSPSGSFLIKDCKLNATTTIATPLSTGMTVQIVRSDSSTAAYKSARYQYEGTETTEATITRVGGAVDPSGQAQTRKIVTTANAQWLRPFMAEPYAIWNATTGANVTVTVFGTINSASLPLNDEIFMEVEYLGSASTPIGTIVTTTKASLLASSAAVASDDSSWNGTSGAIPTWDAATVTNVMLSGGGLVATNTGTTSADQGARVASLAGQSSGKYYFEVTFTTNTGGGNRSVGIGTTASTYTNMGNSATTGSVVYVSSGAVYSNGSSQGFSIPGVSGAGTVFGVAVDLDNRLIWFRTAPSGNWNNNASYNPATGVGGVTIPAGTMVPFVTFGGTGGSANSVFTANFGASAFTGAVPSGFSSGWVPNWSPFKLVATLSSPQPAMVGVIEARIRAAKASTTYYIDPQPVLT